MAAGPAGQPTPTPVGPKISRLIEQLGDRDVHKRGEAGKQLEGIGEAGRPALVYAARHANLPEVRARATRLLVTMNWSTPRDPSPVHQALQDYRAADPDARIAAATRLM